MDEFELRRMLYDYIKEICHFSQMQVFSTSSYQKNYFQVQIDEAISGLINMVLAYNKASMDQIIEKQQQQEHQVQQQQQQEQQQEQQEQQQVEGMEPQTENSDVVREFTLEELTYNDGSEGKPAYVAVNGNVYDVSEKIRWAGGTHFGLYAGKDLSNEFMGCHMGMAEVLQRVPKIGILKNNITSPEL